MAERLISGVFMQKIAVADALLETAHPDAQQFVTHAGPAFPESFYSHAFHQLLSKRCTPP